MRREVLFVPDADTLVDHRTQMREAHTPGTRDHLEACLFEWIACYSRGDELMALRHRYGQHLPQAVEAHAAAGGAGDWDLGLLADYQVAIQLLSIAILLEREQEELVAIRSLFGLDGRDLLADVMLAALDPAHDIADAPLHPDLYRDLLQGIEEQQPLQRRNALLRFLRRYYEGLAAVPWHEAHQRDYSGFFGYWAFEFTACVKLFKLDDRPFADNIYYARDLVHGHIYRSWLPTGYGDHQRSQVAKLEKAWQKEADAQVGKIESEVEKAQNSIRSFVEEVLRQGQGRGSKEAATKAMGRTAESLRLLSDLSGLDSKELDRNPAMAKAFIIGLLQTVSETAVAGEGADHAELQQAMGEAAERMAVEEGLDIKAFEDELPLELRKRLAELTQLDGKAAYRARMRNFSQAIQSLIQDDQVDEEELLASLERLAVEYGFKDTELSVKDRVKKELDEKHKDLRAGKSMIDFSFEDLFNGKGPSTE